jgi:ABC-type lipoprotein export system ATPase subunit
VDLEAAEGEVTAILCGDGVGSDALFRVLSFKNPPSSGEIRFQGRVVGRQGPDELDGMRERALVLQDADWRRYVASSTAPDPCPSIILVNATTLECCDQNSSGLMPFLKKLAANGAAVLLATTDPSLALLSDAVYKLSRGKVQEIDSKRQGGAF